VVSVAAGLTDVMFFKAINAGVIPAQSYRGTICGGWFWCIIAFFEPNIFIVCEFKAAAAVSTISLHLDRPEHDKSFGDSTKTDHQA
jgi:hypothetical protein